MPSPRASPAPPRRSAHGVSASPRSPRSPTAGPASPRTSPSTGIAIIDGGFQGYTAKLGSELPANVVVKNFVDGQPDAEVDATTPHGTACAEIVYDMAPSAQLYLIKIATDVDLDQYVEPRAGLGRCCRKLRDLLGEGGDDG